MSGLLSLSNESSIELGLEARFMTLCTSLYFQRREEDGLFMPEAAEAIQR